ncbi:SGNH/GDSL hydrolase family protein [Tateyamaria armeniaca]|uniref:SGNH/GDSL hydrolase family protein n=1 Tax=Tateyamaria armeniaca TaxID=2518930 RepID=A0ABW8UY79_9RHOB
MAPRSLLCFGDSNTHGTLAMRHMGDRRRLAKPERWTSVMGEALGPEWNVIAEGHPGRTTVFEDPIEGVHKSGLRALPALLESHRPLDLVLIILGTNDLKARFGLTAFDIALGVQRLALDTRRSDSGPDGQPPKVMLVAPVAALESGCLAPIFEGCAPKSAALPGHLGQIAAANDLGFVDLNAVAQVDPLDGIHLDAQAHAAIGTHVAQAVTEFMTQD